jgi:hypothetical protein
MKPSYEILTRDLDQSFRCFDRRRLETPVKWHRHREIELTYVERGSGSRLVGDHIGEYANHDLVLLGSNLPHTWTSDEYRGKKYDRHAAIVIQFLPDFLGPTFFETAELKQVKELLVDAERGLWFPPEVATSIGERMNQTLDQVGASRLINLLTCLDGLARSSAPTKLASKGYEGPTTQEAESRIRSVCDYIQLNFSHPDLSSSELADLLLMNPSSFSRFFKQATGRTPLSYINALRIALLADN